MNEETLKNKGKMRRVVSGQYQCWCIITVSSEHQIKLYQLRLGRSGVEVNYKVLLVLIISVNDPADNV